MSADQRQFVVALFVRERRQVEPLRGDQLGVGGGHLPRRVTQTLKVEVSAQRDQQLGGRSPRRSWVHSSWLCRRLGNSQTAGRGCVLRICSMGNRSHELVSDAGRGVLTRTWRATMPPAPTRLGRDATF
jgi:hypothetical protein